MLGDLGVLEIIAVILPVGQTDRAVHLEQRRRVVLLDFAHQRGLVVAGSGRHDGHRHAGLLGVELRELLPLRILLGLEVQVVHRTLGRSGHGQSKAQARSQSKGDDFLHRLLPLSFGREFLWSKRPPAPNIRFHDVVCETPCNVYAPIIDQPFQKCKSLFGIYEPFLQIVRDINRHFADSPFFLLRLHPPLFARMCNFVQIFCANWAHTVDSTPILFYNKSRHESGLCHAPLSPYLLRKGAFLWP